MTRADDGRRRGMAAVDYLGAILVVGLLMLALVAVREHRASRRPPVDPVAHVATLVRPITIPRPRATVPRAPRTTTRRRAARRPAPERVVVRPPGWAVGR